MGFDRTGKRPAGARVSPWMVLWAAAVLAAMVTVLAVRSTERESLFMSRVLVEKGAALIRAFEAGTRTGMGMRWSGEQLQTLLEETANQSDILYLAVTDETGMVVAHSDRARIGEMFPGEVDVTVGEQEQSRFTDYSGSRAFEVYRVFEPLAGQPLAPPPGSGRQPFHHSDDGRETGHRPWPGHWEKRPCPIPGSVQQPGPEGRQYIFVGLDATPFEVVRQENVHHITVMSAALLLLGLAAVVALFRAQGHRVARRLLQDEVRRLRREIVRSEKLAAIGSLAAGVAHEIRNPLSSIKGFATYFGGKFPEGSDDREASEVMVREVERLNRAVSQLLEFARPSDLHTRPAEVRELLEHSLKLIREDARARGVEVEMETSPAMPPVIVDTDRIVQALLNLYLNAIQAMEGGGRLTVRATAEGGQVRIEVADTGHGIRAEDIPKVFDPYFTTKSQGTGLGLAVVMKIVEAHGGALAVASEPGRGSVFTVTLGTDGAGLRAA